jgi:hypothetical protein
MDMEDVFATVIEVMAIFCSGITLLWLSGAIALHWYETGGYQSDPYYHGD